MSWSNRGLRAKMSRLHPTITPRRTLDSTALIWAAKARCIMALPQASPKGRMRMLETLLKSKSRQEVCPHRARRLVGAWV